MNQSLAPCFPKTAAFYSASLALPSLLGTWRAANGTHEDGKNDLRSFENFKSLLLIPFATLYQYGEFKNCIIIIIAYYIKHLLVSIVARTGES